MCTDEVFALGNVAVNDLTMSAACLLSKYAQHYKKGT